MLNKIYLCSVTDYVDPHSMWLAIKSDGISFNAKASQKLDLHSYTSVKFHRDHEDPRKISRLYVEPSKDPKSLSCWRFTVDQTKIARKTGSARFCPCRTFIDSIPNLKKISKRDTAHEKRLQLDFDDQHKMYFVNVIPNFENSINVDQNIPAVPALYSLIRRNKDLSRADIVNIGQTCNLQQRIKQKLNLSWDFYFIDYSIIDVEKDRKYWETFYLDDFREIHGFLPTYNLQGGQRFDDQDLEINNFKKIVEDQKEVA